MSAAHALFFVGLLDLLLSVVFFHQCRRLERQFKALPDPGPWVDRTEYHELKLKVETLRIVRIVCLNTGGSLSTTGLVMMVGWL